MHKRLLSHVYDHIRVKNITKETGAGDVMPAACFFVYTGRIG
ncbi:hypothetical protein [Anaerosporobacter faecicola]|nr:hypothetical protein [Anaerosporobacter faecicola]